jgi:hypothetical protein
MYRTHHRQRPALLPLSPFSRCRLPLTPDPAVLSVCGCQVISGLSYPRLTVLCGIVYIVGRAVFGMAYRSSGAGGRSAGSRIFYPALITLLISSVVSAINLSGGVQGMTDFGLSFFKF